MSPTPGLAVKLLMSQNSWHYVADSLPSPSKITSGWFPGAFKTRIRDRTRELVVEALVPAPFPPCKLCRGRGGAEGDDLPAGRDDTKGTTEVGGGCATHRRWSRAGRTSMRARRRG